MYGHHSFWGPITERARESRTEFARIQRRLRRENRRRDLQGSDLKGQVQQLRHELEFVTLTLTSLLSELDHRGTLTREDLRAVMVEVDEYDGAVDGRLPVTALEELMRPPVLEEIPVVEKIPDE